jgi:hypothetical protein
MGYSILVGGDYMGKTKKVVKQNFIRKNVMIIFLLVVIVASTTFYILGLNHGRMQVAFYIAADRCDLINMTPIYPYGCEHNDMSDTVCMVMDCQMVGQDLNGAVCDKLNNTDTFFGENGKLAVMATGLAITGCPTYIETIGINPVTGNRNWWLK